MDQDLIGDYLMIMGIAGLVMLLLIALVTSNLGAKFIKMAYNVQNHTHADRYLCDMTASEVKTMIDTLNIYNDLSDETIDFTGPEWKITEYVFINRKGNLAVRSYGRGFTEEDIEITHSYLGEIYLGEL
jgi:hypothetical protein